jgi:Zn-dependent oligopeptidase
MVLDNESLAAKREQLYSEIVQLRNELNDKQNIYDRLDKIVPKQQTVLEDPEDPASEKQVTMPIIDQGTGAEMAEARRQEIFDELVKSLPSLAD